MVCTACCHMALVLDIIHLHKIMFFIFLFLPIPFLYIFKKNLVLIDEMVDDTSMFYPHTLLTGVILKELFENLCLMLVYAHFVSYLCRDGFCGLT